MTTGGRDGGMVTAEAAALLPVAALALAVGWWLALVAVTWLRCQGAVDVGSALAARGAGPAAVRAAVLRDVPPGARVTVAGDGRSTTVTVADVVTALGGPVGRWLSVTVRTSAAG